MIHLFRHTEAGRRRDWNGPDEQRPLTGEGWRQAEEIADRLAAAGVGRILTSPYVRCAQSVEPLARRTGLPVETEPRLAEGTPLHLVEELVAESEPGTVLCTHGDVVAGLIGMLVAEGAGLDGGMVWEKGSVWALERGPGGRIRAGSYTPPPVIAT